MTNLQEFRNQLKQGNLTRRDVLKMGMALGVGSLTASIVGPNLSAAAAQPEKKWRCAYSSVGLAASWVARGADTMTFLGDLLGIEVKVYDGQLSVDKQRQNTEDIAAQDWDFVCIHPLAIEAYVAPIKQLTSRGIMVFDLDTKLTEDLSTLDIVTFLEPDNIFMGSAVTKKLVDAIGGKGQIVHTQGVLTHTGAQGRAKGFHMVVDQYPDIQVVDETPGDWDVDKTRKIWEDLLVKYPDIVGGMFHNDDMAMAAYGAIKAAGKEKQIKIVGVDGMQPALRAVIDGTLLATVVNPTGRIHGGAMWIAWQILTGKHKKEDVPKFIRTDGPLVDETIAPGLLYLADNLMI